MILFSFYRSGSTSQLEFSLKSDRTLLVKIQLVGCSYLTFQSHHVFMHYLQCHNRDVLGGWCDSGNIFVADVVAKEGGENEGFVNGSPLLTQVVSLLLPNFTYQPNRFQTGKPSFSGVHPWVVKSIKEKNHSQFNMLIQSVC